MFGRLLPARNWRALAAVVLSFVGLVAPAPATAQTQTAVEYYYADWNYYFVTAFPDEIALLDGGAFDGVWKRTGQTFNVWIDASSGALPTCRFFSTNFAPKSSHFYTPYAAECATVKSNPDWQYESIAFYLQLPDANGNCAAGTTILYRLYNNGMGGAPNHRFTTDSPTFSQMRTTGWTFEGNGLTGAFACVPQSSPKASPMAGFWTATVGPNGVDGIVLDDGTFYFVYFTGYSADFIQGTANAANGQFSSSDAIDVYVSVFGGVSHASFAGTYVPQKSLNGMIASASLASLSFAASYDPSYEQPASLTDAAGTYSGYGESSTGVRQASLTLSPTGKLSGQTVGSGIPRSFAGSMTPHENVNVFDVSLTFSGTGCDLVGVTVSGVGGYDGEGGLVVIAMNSTRSDGFLFGGSKQ